MKNKLCGEIAITLSMKEHADFTDETRAQMRGQCHYIAQQMFDGTPHWWVDYKAGIGYFLVPIESIPQQVNESGHFNDTEIKMKLEVNR